MINVRELFGEIDIYLFDQIMKGRFAPGMKILDAGCGSGRNLIYFLKNDFEVFAVDEKAEAVGYVRSLARDTAPENFQVARVENMPFEDANFDWVISSAVLHFARDEEHFYAMVREMWRVLARSGILFARLASTIGIESGVRRVNGRRFHLPDGSERFLVDEDMLTALAADLNADWAEPLKTTNVQNLRSMTTWVIRKEAD
jgi:tellurite methyltransferase